jgi:hypothetical protein
MDANREAAEQGDEMSSRAGRRTSGSTNPIEPQPAAIPGGLGLRLGRIAMWAAIIALLIVLIWRLT